jgi:hypothetical protein
LKSTSKQNLWLGVIAVALLGGIAWLSLRDTGGSGKDSGNVKISQTLSPTKFEGKTREAYQAAADVPEVLEQLPCFCGCMENNGHDNNLFCFRDAHAAT